MPPDPQAVPYINPSFPREGQHAAVVGDGQDRRGQGDHEYQIDDARTVMLSSTPGTDARHAARKAMTTTVAQERFFLMVAGLMGLAM